MPENIIREIGELQGIVSSKLLREVIGLHKDYLQEKINTFVRTQKFTEAYGELCKFDDVDKIIKLLELRIEELKKEK